jgi:phage gp29-like protein
MAGAGHLPKNDMAIISRIVGEFTNRSRQNIQDWRMALDAADHHDNPRWQPLQDLYEYLRPDAHLGSQIDIRKGSVTASRFFVREATTGKESKDKTMLLKKKWFKNLMKDLLDSIFLGFTYLQIQELGTHGKYFLIPRRNTIPQKDLLLFQTWGTDGVDLNDPAFRGTIISIKNQYRFGIMNDIVQDLIWKKNARQAWAEFSEKFGIPLINVTTNKTDKKELDRIESMARALAQASVAILPEGSTLKIDESGTKGDPYKTFLEQVKYCDGQISKRILGGTMVSDDGSSRSQSEVHERTKDDILGEDDKSDIEFVINDQLMPLLIASGIGLAEGDEFVFDRTQKLTLDQLWKIVNEALDHYEIEDEWVSETFSIPIKARKAKSSGEPAKGPAGFFD